MTNYTPLDNDSDIDDFDAEKIEQMEVELVPCPHCKGSGILFNGVIYWRCPKCAGTGEITREGVRLQHLGAEYEKLAKEG